MPFPKLFRRRNRYEWSSDSSEDESTPRASVDPDNFHSIRDEMARAALEGEPVAPSHSSNTHDCGLLSDTPFAGTVYDDTPFPPFRRPVRRAGDRRTGDGESESSSENETFYTPSGSPRTSLVGGEGGEGNLGREPAGAKTSVHADVTCTRTRPDLQTQPHIHFSLPHTSSSPSSSTAPSISSFFSNIPSPSTRATTPNSLFSDFDRSSLASLRSISTSPSNKRKGKKRSSIPDYSGQDWAKQVRWLVDPASFNNTDNTPGGPSSTPASTQTSPQRTKLKRQSLPEPVQTQMISPAPSPLPPGIPPERRRRAMYRRSSSGSSHSHGRRSIGRRRMSAVWEEDENDDANGGASSPRRVHTDPAPLSSLARPRRASTLSAVPFSNDGGEGRYPRPYSALSNGSGVSLSSSTSSFTLPSRVVDLPVPLPVSDGGTPTGYTSLVLPRAAYSTSKRRYSLRFGSDSRIDITRSGLSQTTMSTISITKNAAAAAYGARPRFLSLSSLTLLANPSETKLKLSASTPAHLLSSLPPPLSFTSATPPPTRVNPNQVLVQVYAVGVDGLDDLIVHEKAQRVDCYGFVPGRSFVGRAVECGFEVSAVAKSDWVFGLLDVRKCGALAEFVVVDKRRLARCPRPSSTLTMEQLALLPLCGVPAHRAIGTVDDADDYITALVLQGHDGAGAIAVQELVALKLRVTVQIPPANPDSDGKVSEKDVLSMRLAEERVRRYGVSRIIIDDVDAAIKSLEANSYDIVIDTVGGKSVWDACRRVLRSNGQFTTLAGEDTRTVPNARAQVRSNWRSLKRAFVKQDRKALGYAWVSPAADVGLDGEDVRDSLIAIAERIMDIGIRPWVDPMRLVPFESTPALFKTGDRTVLKEGRTGVIRIID